MADMAWALAKGIFGRAAKPAMGLALGGAVMGALNPNRGALSGSATTMGSIGSWGMMGAIGGAAWGAGNTLARYGSAFGKAGGGFAKGLGAAWGKPMVRGLMGRNAIGGAMKFGKYGLMAGAALGLGKALLGSNQPVMPV